MEVAFKFATVAPNSSHGEGASLGNGIRTPALCSTGSSDE